MASSDFHVFNYKSERAQFCMFTGHFYFRKCLVMVFAHFSLEYLLCTLRLSFRCLSHCGGNLTFLPLVSAVLVTDSKNTSPYCFEWLPLISRITSLLNCYSLHCLSAFRAGAVPGLFLYFGSASLIISLLCSSR